MSQENVDAVRSSLEGWNRGDIDAWLGSPHPDVEFRTSGALSGSRPDLPRACRTAPVLDQLPRALGVASSPYRSST